MAIEAKTRVAALNEARGAMNRRERSDCMFYYLKAMCLVTVANLNVQ
ncbi:hypothetical protein GCM10027022_02150 [Alpinimonas psychrophila]